MELDPRDHDWNQLYRLVTSVVVPRPIGWFSTYDGDANDNLAPFSSFNYVSHQPPVLMFTAGTRENGELKDTPRNAIEHGEFVFNLVSSALAARMVRTSEALAADESEFNFAGVERADSVTVDPPRVADAPVSLECSLYDTYRFDHGRVMVMGEVTYAHVDDAVLTDGEVDASKVDAVGRLGGPYYTGTDVVEF
jgi:flavin reductase (DIM6/NTAB) family NADH-FMN oxidoreductase RutF